jgi:rRNA maturation protein Nop10
MTKECEHLTIVDFIYDTYTVKGRCEACGSPMSNSLRRGMEGGSGGWEADDE